MKTINGIAGIIFAEKDDEPYFLLLHRVLNWKGWEFVKGRLDSEDEDEALALKREIEEETGLTNVTIVKKLEEKLEFISRDQERRSNHVFLVKADIDEPVNLEQDVVEHDDFKWVTGEKALEMISWPSQKALFKIALEELEN